MILEPICKRKLLTFAVTCAPITGSLSNGDFVYSTSPLEDGRYQYNTVLTYSCNNEYRLTGTVNRTCGDGLLWSANNPPAQCVQSEFQSTIMKFNQLHYLLDNLHKIQLRTCRSVFLYILVLIDFFYN